MKTKAVRLYGENDVRLEEFELPALKDGEILIKIISDSACMSTYKTIKQGAKHIRVPDNVAENPVIIGHEFCAEVVEVTDKWKDKFQVGDKVVIVAAGYDKAMGTQNGNNRAAVLLHLRPSQQQRHLLLGHERRHPAHDRVSQG